MLRQPSASSILVTSRRIVSRAATSNNIATTLTTDDAAVHNPRVTYTPTRSASSSSTMSAAPQQQRQAPPATFFPLGYKEAAYQWWSSVTPPMAERNVLRLMTGLTEAGEATSYAPGTRIWRRTMVPLSGRNRALNELSIEQIGEDQTTAAEATDTLVMVHGYGAGLGFFYKNFEPMTRMPGLRFYALDLLGMGNSSRPAFRIKARERQDQIREAESWFVDALEEWRVARGIDRFTLLGHSLGGYLAVSYALKYPGHLNKLILASPVGIPKDPYAVDAEMPEPQESTLENEFTVDQDTATTKAGPSPPPPVPDSAPAAVAKLQQHQQSPAASPAAASTTGSPTPPRMMKRPLPSWLVWLWDANISPFSIVRLTGPLGPRFVSGWTSRRFNHLPDREAQALHDYAFSIFRQRGSGEYALAYILAPGAYARRPVIDRIHGVGRQPLPPPGRASTDSLPDPAPSSTPGARETGFPIVFMYGENDWMDVAGGLAAEEKLKAARADALAHATDNERQRENGSCRIVVIPKAGHHLYLDNPTDFNRVICDELELTRQDEMRRRQLDAKARE